MCISPPTILKPVPHQDKARRNKQRDTQALAGKRATDTETLLPRSTERETPTRAWEYITLTTIPLYYPKKLTFWSWSPIQPAGLQGGGRGASHPDQTKKTSPQIEACMTKRKPTFAFDFLNQTKNQYEIGDEPRHPGCRRDKLQKMFGSDGSSLYGGKKSRKESTASCSKHAK